jgi:hypothetical protein
MMPASVRGGSFAAFGTFSRQKPDLVKKARGGDADQGVWVSPQYNATHIISIPGNWLIGGDLAALMTAERHFLLEVQYEPDRFLATGDLAVKVAIDIASASAFPLNRNRDSISLL